jgi:MoaA/NifB/PqqE/SkfB family radical SAM enzyme
MGRRNVYLSPDEWMVHWKRIYDKYGEVKIEIVGGEPFIYPNFIELVKKLSSIHLVKITTNLSGDIDYFAKEINPERVDLDLNFHILFIDLETVIRKALILKKADFKGGVCYLAYPPQMYKIGYLSERFKKEGIGFALAAFWGEYNGKKYPESYTEEEREMMRPFMGDADRVKYHLNAKSPRGKLCNAGYRYASVQADGNVVRCGPLGEKSIGNILDENFKLFTQPVLCSSDYCPCDEYDNIIENTTHYESPIIIEGAQGVAEEEKITVVDVKASKSKDASQNFIIEAPKYPRSSPPYRVHWNWELSYKCNYQCSYCPWWKKGKEEKHTFFESVTVDSWRKIWDEVFKKYWCSHVRFSGGEPTIYPNFFDLVAILLERHTVDITTNLSFDITNFATKVKPGGISISASFHPEFNEIDPFLEKVIFLHKNGYPSTIAYVAYPPHLEKIKKYKSIAEGKGIMFKVIPYQGEFQNRFLPRDYTTKEKCLMEGLSGDSINTHLNELNSRWYEWHVKKEDENREKRGNLCRMGQMYAKIHPDGKVSRCCAVGKDSAVIGILGDITDLNFRLFDEPKPCEADKCPCFKSMLVGDEEDKWLSLWEASEHPIYRTEYMRDFINRNETLKLDSRDVAVVNSAVKKDAPKADKKLDNVDCKLVQPGRIFFTWDIQYACNYRCTYCFFSKRWDEISKENRYLELHQWQDIWDDIFKRYGEGHIHISGGEPFTYPAFIDIVAHLIKRFSVEFDTNLSFDISEFTAKIKPGNVKFATAFHPKFVSLDAYLSKVLLLKQKGFDIGVNYVAYPEQLKEMKECKKVFECHHISFDVMPFRGEYNSRQYPKGYTEAEKELIRDCDPRTAPRMLESYGGEKKLCRTGAICRMGQMYTKIHPNGDAYRCCYIDKRGVLGNIIDRTFSLYDEPRLCEYPECSCWTAMIEGKEEEWLSHWATPRKTE